MNQAAHAHYELDPEKLRQVLPDSPGVYCFKDTPGRIIYVGKAKSLRKRVLSYFRPREDLSDKTALMMKRASGLDFILTTTKKRHSYLRAVSSKNICPVTTWFSGMTSSTHVSGWISRSLIPAFVLSGKLKRMEPFILAPFHLPEVYEVPIEL